MLEYLTQWMQALEERLNLIEQRTSQSLGRLHELANAAHNAATQIENQQQTVFGLYTALCVSTKDPEGRCRVSYFNPHFYDKNTKVGQLRWAEPVRNSGGIDDTGWNWTPQAGSLLAIEFANGNRTMPYYFGTIWYDTKSDYDKGMSQDFLRFWEEYDQYHKGHRRGYLLGPNDDSQCYQPWSTEMYNAYDPYDTSAKIVTDSSGRQVYANQAQIRAGASLPHIYGCSTPQKHRLKFVDGLYDAFYKYKRVELVSSLCNALLLKDDFLNPCEAIRNNPYFKNAQEAWPYEGPGTPQNNKYMLPQTGAQLITRAGATWFGDDSVEVPRGIPSWEANFQPEADGTVTNRRRKFDFGETDRFLGKTGWISALGERILMSDEESSTGIRSENCGIFIDSTTGSFVHLNNHTNDDGTAGSERGFSAGSSSGHILEMKDEGNEQDLPFRKAGAEPESRARAAYVSLRSGGGLELMFNDGTSQQETADQFAYLYVPQDANPDRPGHMLRFQARKDGPGQVLFEIGGDYIVRTYDQHETIVGSEDNQADKVVRVSGNNVSETAEIKADVAKEHRILADEFITLFAGEDARQYNPRTGKVAEIPNTAAIVMWDPKRGLVASDRVFGSASPDAMKVPISATMPFTTGQGDDEEVPTEIADPTWEEEEQAWEQQVSSEQPQQDTTDTPGEDTTTP